MQHVRYAHVKYICNYWRKGILWETILTAEHAQRWPSPIALDRPWTCRGYHTYEKCAIHATFPACKCRWGQTNWNIHIHNNTHVPLITKWYVDQTKKNNCEWNVWPCIKNWKEIVPQLYTCIYEYVYMDICIDLI